MKKNAVKKILVVFMAMVLSFSWSLHVYAQSTQDKLNQKENERNETQQEKNEAEEKYAEGYQEYQDGLKEFREEKADAVARFSLMS